MKHLAFIAALLSLPALPAPAQPSSAAEPSREKVIVTAPGLKPGVTPNAVAHDFIFHYAAPTVLRDAIPRWQVGICPEIRGVADNFASFIETRIRAIAAEAEAPLKAKGCRPNLSITFTPKPQELLDNVRARNSDALGYHGERMVVHPVQAWYVTGITDIDGRTELDRDEGGSVEDPCGGQKNRPPCWSMPTSKIGGWKFHPDATSDLLYVTVIIDSAKTARYGVGEIADYIAMLALTQTRNFEGCEPVASIANLLASDCADGLKPAEITQTDIAFLRGIYKMDAGATLAIQQDQIAGEMAKALKSRSN